jgi:post-segregation antitoxin (ccd killing protein)
MPDTGFRPGQPNETNVLVHLKTLAQKKATRERQWLDENHDAIKQHNRYVEENGLTLEEYRTF